MIVTAPLKTHSSKSLASSVITPLIRTVSPPRQTLVRSTATWLFSLLS